MGRKKSYDREELIGKAVELFRDHGYTATSTQTLVEALGVNRYSLYAEFGSKQALFDVALESYNQEVVDRRYGPLEEPTSGLPAVRALFEFYRSSGDGPAAGRGCLLCNTAVELGASDPSGAGHVTRYFERIKGAFQSSLTQAQAEGSLRPGVNPEHEASFFTASVLGLYVMLRAAAPREAIAQACDVALEHLESISVHRGAG